MDVARREGIACVRDMPPILMYGKDPRVTLACIRGWLQALRRPVDDGAALVLEDRCETNRGVRIRFQECSMAIVVDIAQNTTMSRTDDIHADSASSSSTDVNGSGGFGCTESVWQLIKNFASTRDVSGNHRILVIHNAESLEMHHINALRRLMEQASHACLFIITCTRTSAMGSGLCSRCMHVACCSDVSDPDDRVKSIEVEKTENAARKLVARIVSNAATTTPTALVTSARHSLLHVAAGNFTDLCRCIAEVIIQLDQNAQCPDADALDEVMRKIALHESTWAELKVGVGSTSHSTAYMAAMVLPLIGQLAFDVREWALKHRHIHLIRPLSPLRTHAASSASAKKKTAGSSSGANKPGPSGAAKGPLRSTKGRRRGVGGGGGMALPSR